MTLAFARRMALAIATVSSASACSTSVFGCDDAAQCTRGNVAGVCQPEGYCSFPDESCESGQRFGEHAESSLAGECVRPDGSADAGSTSSPGSTSSSSTSETEPTTGGVTGEVSSASDSESSTGQDSASECPDWWDCAWSHRRRLSIPEGAADLLVDVPVLVLLTSNRIDYGVVADDGADLRFVVEEDGTRLAHEVERWQPGGTSVIWVKVPRIEANSTGGALSMYYGSAGAPNDERPPEVWSNGYLAVWHLETETDSLGNYPLQPNGAQPTEGRIGGGYLFDGGTTWMTVMGDMPLVDVFEGGGTVSAWIHAETWGQHEFGRIIESCSGTAAEQGWSFSVSNGTESPASLRFGHDFADTRGEWRGSSQSISHNQWHLVAASYDNTTPVAPLLTVDGADTTFLATSQPVGASLQTSTAPTTIGRSAAGSHRYFDGVIDEVRLSGVLRSEAWLELQHRSMTDALLVFGDEELAPAR